MQKQESQNNLNSSQYQSQQYQHYQMSQSQISKTSGYGQKIRSSTQQNQNYQQNYQKISNNQTANSWLKNAANNNYYNKNFNGNINIDINSPRTVFAMEDLGFTENYLRQINQELKILSKKNDLDDQVKDVKIQHLKNKKMNCYKEILEQRQVYINKDKVKKEIYLKNFLINMRNKFDSQEKNILQKYNQLKQNEVEKDQITEELQNQLSIIDLEKKTILEKIQELEEALKCLNFQQNNQNELKYQQIQSNNEISKQAYYILEEIVECCVSLRNIQDRAKNKNSKGNKSNQQSFNNKNNKNNNNDNDSNNKLQQVKEIQEGYEDSEKLIKLRGKVQEIQKNYEELLEKVQEVKNQKLQQDQFQKEQKLKQSNQLQQQNLQQQQLIKKSNLTSNRSLLDQEREESDKIRELEQEYQKNNTQLQHLLEIFKNLERESQNQGNKALLRQFFANIQEHVSDLVYFLRVLKQIQQNLKDQEEQVGFIYDQIVLEEKKIQIQEKMEECQNILKQMEDKGKYQGDFQGGYNKDDMQENANGERIRGFQEKLGKCRKNVNELEKLEKNYTNFVIKELNGKLNLLRNEEEHKQRKLVKEVKIQEILRYLEEAEDNFVYIQDLSRRLEKGLKIKQIRENQLQQLKDYQNQQRQQQQQLQQNKYQQLAKQKGKDEQSEEKYSIEQIQEGLKFLQEIENNFEFVSNLRIEEKELKEKKNSQGNNENSNDGISQKGISKMKGADGEIEEVMVNLNKARKKWKNFAGQNLIEARQNVYYQSPDKKIEEMKKKQKLRNERLLLARKKQMEMEIQQEINKQGVEVKELQRQQRAKKEMEKRKKEEEEMQQIKRRALERIHEEQNNYDAKQKEIQEEKINKQLQKKKKIEQQYYQEFNEQQNHLDEIRKEMEENSIIYTYKNQNQQRVLVYNSFKVNFQNFRHIQLLLERYSESIDIVERPDRNYRKNQQKQQQLQQQENKQKNQEMEEKTFYMNLVGEDSEDEKERNNQQKFEFYFQEIVRKELLELQGKFKSLQYKEENIKQKILSNVNQITQLVQVIDKSKQMRKMGEFQEYVYKLQTQNKGYTQQGEQEEEGEEEENYGQQQLQQQQQKQEIREKKEDGNENEEIKQKQFLEQQQKKNQYNYQQKQSKVQNQQKMKQNQKGLQKQRSFSENNYGKKFKAEKINIINNVKNNDSKSNNNSGYKIKNNKIYNQGNTMHLNTFQEIGRTTNFNKQQDWIKETDTQINKQNLEIEANQQSQQQQQQQSQQKNNIQKSTYGGSILNKSQDFNQNQYQNQLSLQFEKAVKENGNKQKQFLNKFIEKQMSYKKRSESRNAALQKAKKEREEMKRRENEERREIKRELEMEEKQRKQAKLEQKKLQAEQIKMEKEFRQNQQEMILREKLLLRQQEKKELEQIKQMRMDKKYNQKFQHEKEVQRHVQSRKNKEEQLKRRIQSLTYSLEVEKNQLTQRFQHFSQTISKTDVKKYSRNLNKLDQNNQEIYNKIIGKTLDFTIEKFEEPQKTDKQENLPVEI